MAISFSPFSQLSDYSPTFKLIYPSRIQAWTSTLATKNSLSPHSPNTSLSRTTTTPSISLKPLPSPHVRSSPFSQLRARHLLQQRGRQQLRALAARGERFQRLRGGRDDQAHSRGVGAHPKPTQGQERSWYLTQEREWQEKEARKADGRRQLEEYLARKEQEKLERAGENLRKEAISKEELSKLNVEAGWRKVITNINVRQGEHKGKKETNRMREAILHRR